MTVSSHLKSDFDNFVTSTDAMLNGFASGDMYARDPLKYNKTIISVCDHFKRGLKGVLECLNQLINMSVDLERNPSEAIDYFDDSFNLLEEYVQFICDDFAHFKNTVTAVVPKEGMEYRCNVDFNLVDNLVSDLDKNVERVRTELMSHFMLKLTDEELESRAA